MQRYTMIMTRREFLQSTALAGLGASTCSMSVATAQSSAVRPAPLMPAPSFVSTNGISMAVCLRSSTKSAWRGLLVELSSAGAFGVSLPLHARDKRWSVECRRQLDLALENHSHLGTLSQLENRSHLRPSSAR